MSLTEDTIAKGTTMIRGMKPLRNMTTGMITVIKIITEMMGTMTPKNGNREKMSNREGTPIGVIIEAQTELGTKEDLKSMKGGKKKKDMVENTQEGKINTA